MAEPQSKVASPCINVCRIDALTGWCEGCKRNLQEIAAWSTMDADRQRAVLRQLPSRRVEWRRVHRGDDDRGNEA